MEQITDTIVHLMVQAPNLSHTCFGTYCLRKVRDPAENTRWPPVFNMAASSNAKNAGLRKNYQTDFHETRWKGVAWPHLEPIKFWSRSESRAGSRTRPNTATHSPPFISWTRIMQKLPDRFSRNLVEGCSMAPLRTHYILEPIRITGRVHEPPKHATHSPPFISWTRGGPAPLLRSKP